VKHGRNAEVTIYTGSSWVGTSYSPTIHRLARDVHRLAPTVHRLELAVHRCALVVHSLASVVRSSKGK
ncbi:hypothetical protein HAX54_042576, partial [Datura stramonium]|nr:hypothetical protein [Datura stramonium]